MSNGDVKIGEDGRVTGPGIVDNRDPSEINGTNGISKSASQILGWNYDSEHLYNTNELDLSYHDKINKDPNRVKFAYWVPNVSGGLVISKIEQRTSWELEPNQRYAQTAEQWGFEYAVCASECRHSMILGPYVDPGRCRSY